MTGRIDRRFAALREEGRAALVTFIMAGDPDYDTSLAILKALPQAGADVIEIGMPFTDPMADGPAIQAAGLRALKAGQNMKQTLALVREFRAGDDATPIVLMGYYNPIYVYGVDAFLADAKSAGVDGLIVVDLPPEEDAELCLPALQGRPQFHPPRDADDRRQAAADGAREHVGLRLLRLDHRHHRLGRAGPERRSREAVARIKRHTTLPVCVGFGVRTAEQARGDRAKRRRRRGRLGAGRGLEQEPRRGRQGDGCDGACRRRHCSRARQGRRTRRRHRPRRLRAYDMTAFFSTQAMISNTKNAKSKKVTTGT